MKPLRILLGVVLIAAGTGRSAVAEAQDSVSTRPSTAEDSAAAGLMRPGWAYYVQGDRLLRVDATPNEYRESVGAGVSG